MVSMISIILFPLWYFFFLAALLASVYDTEGTKISRRDKRIIYDSQKDTKFPLQKYLMAIVFAIFSPAWFICFVDTGKVDLFSFIFSFLFFIRFHYFVFFLFSFCFILFYFVLFPLQVLFHFYGVLLLHIVPIYFIFLYPLISIFPPFHMINLSLSLCLFFYLLFFPFSYLRTFTNFILSYFINTFRLKNAYHHIRS